MSLHDDTTTFLKRADEARAQAAFAGSFMTMDELLDIAAAWRALAAEAKRLNEAASARAIPSPVIKVARRAGTKSLRLVVDRDKHDAA